MWEDLGEEDKMIEISIEDLYMVYYFKVKFFKDVFFVVFNFSIY